MHLTQLLKQSSLAALATCIAGGLRCAADRTLFRASSFPLSPNHQDHISIRPDQMLCIKTVDTSDNSLHQLFTGFIQGHQELIMFLMVT
jgi:hypothetical protein